jgi:aryl-alcohol dehydrogenase-like predicted oxidoreductase
MFRRHRVEVEYQHLYSSIGLGTTIFSPLASGILTNKYSSGIPDDSRLALSHYEWLKKQSESREGKEKIEKTAKLSNIAGELGISLSRMAIAWCLKNPAVSTVITGASKPEQVKENMNALSDIPLLDDEVMEKIELILDNKPRPEKDHRSNWQ